MLLFGVNVKSKVICVPSKLGEEFSVPLVKVVLFTLVISYLPSGFQVTSLFILIKLDIAA